MIKASTIYLALAVICLGLMIFFPVFLIASGDNLFEFRLESVHFNDGVMKLQYEHFYFNIILIFLIIYTIATVFFFRKLKIQSIMTRMNYLFHTGFILLLYFTMKSEISTWKDTIVLYRGFYFPIASITFLFLANRSIKQELKILELLERLKQQK